MPKNSRHERTLLVEWNTCFEASKKTLRREEKLDFSFNATCETNWNHFVSDVLMRSVWEILSKIWSDGGDIWLIDDLTIVWQKFKSNKTTWKLWQNPRFSTFLTMINVGRISSED